MYSLNRYSLILVKLIIRGIDKVLDLIAKVLKTNGRRPN